MAGEFAYGPNNKADLFRRRNVEFTPEVASFCYQFVLGIYKLVVAAVEAVAFLEIFPKRFWPGGKKDAFSALMVWHIRTVSQPVPQLFRNERDERMHQSESVRKDEIENSDRVRLLGLIFPEENSLRRLEIPVAKLAPKEPVNARRGFIKFVIRERFSDFRNRRVQAQKNPLIVTGQFRGINFALDLSPLHLTITAGIPKLRAEV